MSLWPLLVDRSVKYTDPIRCALEIRRDIRSYLLRSLRALAMSVNIDNDVVDVISCVALFYDKGKSGNSFLCKEKFRAQVPRKEKTLKSVRETVR